MQSKSIFHSIKQGVLICDRFSRILYFNEAYGAFIDHSLADIQGRSITEYRKGALAPSVICSGVPIEGVLRKEGSQEYFVNVYPIQERDTITGSISIVTTLEQYQKKTTHDTLANRVRRFERQEIENMLLLYGHDLVGKKRAADELGISLATLYNKLSCYE